MTNSLFPVPEGTNLPVSADLADDLVSVGSAVESGRTNYLKFSKTGEWVYGADDDQVDSDTIIAVNPASFTIGWQGWNGGVPVEGPVVPISQRGQLPAESELEAIPAGDMNGWNKMLGVSMQILTDGTPLQFSATSYGGKQAITGLMKAVGLGLKSHPEAPVALVKLSGDSYRHAKFGKIHTPVITVVGWADADGKEVKKLAA